MPADAIRCCNPSRFAFGGSADYAPRRPEQTRLHQTVRENLETFLARARERDHPVPRFVERELRAFLACGVLAHGFLRLHCDACGCDRLIPFACKGRGFCPACGAVTFVQRFSSALNLNVHFHTLAPEPSLALSAVNFMTSASSPNHSVE
jgi:hypothetical protein